MQQTPAIAARVAELNTLAGHDPRAAQDEVWAWFKELGARLPGPAAVAELSEIYAAGTPADPDGATEGLLVGFLPAAGLNPAGRLVHAAATGLINGLGIMPWLGKRFDKSARRGTNAVTGFAMVLTRVLAPTYRLHRVEDHWEGFEMLNRVEESVVAPGTQVLVLDYESEEAGNPWPVSNIRDEAVKIVPGTYLGAKLWHQSGGYRQLAYWAARSEVG